MNADEARIRYATNKLREPEHYYQQAKQAIANGAVSGYTEVYCPQEHRQVVGERLAAEGYCVSGCDGIRGRGAGLGIDWRPGAKAGYTPSVIERAYQEAAVVAGDTGSLPPVAHDPLIYLSVAAAASILFFLLRS